MKFFDVHTHTQSSGYDHDREEVIQRALDNGVGLINIGTDRESSKKAIAIAEKYQEGVYAVVGLHPSDLESQKEVEGKEFDYEFYKNLALSSPKVVAIGECGLDYFRINDEELKKKQKIIFRKQIELSQDIKKPLMIHCREAFSDLMKILQENMAVAPLLRKERGVVQTLKSLQTRRGEVSGVIHFFSGSIDDARVLMDLGFSFSFGGVLTFTHDYDEVVHFISLNRILLETDAPYVTPVPHRGKRNEPVFVVEVAKRIAEIKGATFDEVAHTTTANAKALFGI